MRLIIPDTGPKLWWVWSPGVEPRTSWSEVLKLPTWPKCHRFKLPTWPKWHRIRLHFCQVGSLRWGWVFRERTRILSGIQFTTHFIQKIVVATKRFVGSFVNVILTRQTCGQRSSRAAESKRRALGNYFSERICYKFLVSKCRGDQDLGLCTTSVLAFGDPQCTVKIWFFLRRNTFLSSDFASALRILKRIDLDLGLIYILI